MDIYRALDLVPPDGVRVVLLGQEPPRGDTANGLAHGVARGYEPGAVQRNMAAELLRSTGQTLTDFTLESWAKQGVLLLNIHLTTGDMPGSHYGWGWVDLTRHIVQTVAAASGKGIIFLAWGKYCQRWLEKSLSLEQQQDHRILHAAHPSTAQFAGCGHFYKVNRILESRSSHPILWGRTT